MKWIAITLGILKSILIMVSNKFQDKGSNYLGN